MSTQVQVGDRVRMTGLMPNDPDPIPVGTEGTVTGVQSSAYVFPGQIYVDWDIARSLILLDTDPFIIIDKETRP